MEQPTPALDKIASLRKDISVLRTRLDLAQARSAKSTGDSPRTTSPAVSMQELQSTLERNTALLVYQLGDDRSWLWAVTRESASAYELPRREEIERLARTLYATWSSPGVEEANTAQEIAASKAIIGAASRQLKGKDTVVVVADGILNSVPFGALWVESPGAATKRLAETHAVIFRSTIKQGAGGTLRPASEATSGNRILLIGDPTVSKPIQQAKPEFQADPWSWQPLPGTRREVQTIVTIAADWRSYVLLGAEATKPALLSMPLDTFRAIHFATHARLDVQDPQLSSIALSGGETNFASSNATLTVREILGFKLHAETIVLSACEASLGKNYRGQLSFGLSQAFLLAGARNVLGSMWRVSDEAAQEYMRHFYEDYIRNDASPAAAARTAAQAMSREPRFRHPYFWAAFVVTQW
jgi:CHAT domain-containing protein